LTVLPEQQQMTIDVVPPTAGSAILADK